MQHEHRLRPVHVHGLHTHNGSAALPLQHAVAVASARPSHVPLQLSGNCCCSSCFTRAVSTRFCNSASCRRSRKDASSTSIVYVQRTLTSTSRVRTRHLGNVTQVGQFVWICGLPTESGQRLPALPDACSCLVHACVAPGIHMHVASLLQLLRALRLPRTSDTATHAHCCQILQSIALPVLPAGTQYVTLLQEQRQQFVKTQHRCQKLVQTHHSQR